MSPARQKRDRGPSQLPPAFRRGLCRNQPANETGERGLSPFPPRRLLPDLSFLFPQRLSKLQAQPRVSADPGGWEPGIQYFSQGSAMRPSGREGRAGFGKPQRPTLPRAQGLGDGSPGPGAPRGATPPPGLFVLPRGPAAAPTSSLPAERRLAQGFPAAHPRPIGAARAVLGVATRTPRVHASHARPPRCARARPPRRGVARASVRGLRQVAAWTLRPGPLGAAPQSESEMRTEGTGAPREGGGPFPGLWGLGGELLRAPWVSLVGGSPTGGFLTGFSAVVRALETSLLHLDQKTPTHPPRQTGRHSPRTHCQTMRLQLTSWLEGESALSGPVFSFGCILLRPC